MQYTIRVELHDATWDDYSKLYSQMAVRGMTDVIVSDGGLRYKMQPAEYNYDGPLARNQVLANAEAACKVVGKRYSVLVTESAGRTWTGLQQVR